MSGLFVAPQNLRYTYGMIAKGIQQYFDKVAFDPPNEYVELNIQDKKVRHIQLHVAKAAMKLVMGDDEIIKQQVIPDAAIYRSQLLNIIRTDNVPNFLSSFPENIDELDPDNEIEPEPLLSLVEASGNLATYLERREHGVPVNERFLLVAATCLHEAALSLGVYYQVDVDRAQLARLEQNLGYALPESVTLIR